MTVTEYFDGNYNDVIDVQPKPEHADFLLDASGNEVREGNFVRITDGGHLKDDWQGQIVVVRGVRPSRIYVKGTRSYLADRDVWSPSSGFIDVRRPDGWETSFATKQVERVDLSEEDHDRLLLATKEHALGRLVSQIATAEGQRAALQYEINTLRARLSP